MKRRRPVLFVIRHHIGDWLIWLGDKIEGDYRYEQISGPDFDGKYEHRPIPADWVPDGGPDRIRNG